MEEKKMVRIPLQFFGGEDDELDIDDSFFDDEVPQYYGSDDEDDEPDTQDTDGGEDAEESPTGSDADASSSDDDEDGGADREKGAELASEGKDESAELISELRALGYVGDDMSSLIQDMRRKREARAEEDERAEARAVKAEGKSHLHSSVPSRSANGDGTGGITERQVAAFAERTGKSKDEARRMLARHARMFAG